jgi:hypothetical protein
MPGTEPTGRCEWHQAGGQVVLPDLYAAWAPAPIVVPDSVVARRADVGFAITSPRDGDHYAVPPGVDARYATIALRVTGAGGDQVQWTIDGHPITGSRWQLAVGAHEVRARDGNGKTAVAQIVVD